MKKIAIFCALLFLQGCASQNVHYQNGYSGQKTIEQIATLDLKVQKFYTDDFTLYGLLKTQESKQLNVYIEGDGLAWISRTQPSNNPTPTDDVTRLLAVNDKGSSSVLYLARPCQYVRGQDKEDEKLCEQKYWTSHRLAPEVIDSLNSAISQAKEKVGAEKVAIVGYSGGGGAAALVASERDDVIFLGSVAGLLDHERWTQSHNISPLTGSLNPYDSAHRLYNIKQRHITGENDKIITSYINERFCEKIERRQEDACEEVENIGHNGAWYRVWDYKNY